VDLMREEGANQHYQSILKFIRGTIAEKAPIIPISAQLKFNIDAVNEAIVNTIPVPLRDFSMDPQMMIIRSFDVNSPELELKNSKEVLLVDPSYMVFSSLATRLKSDREKSPVMRKELPSAPLSSAKSSL